MQHVTSSTEYIHVVTNRICHQYDDHKSVVFVTSERLLVFYLKHVCVIKCIYPAAFAVEAAEGQREIRVCASGLSTENPPANLFDWGVDQHPR